VISALRLLFVHGPEDAVWRAGFELAQAAAALDVPLELAFAGPGLELITTQRDCARNFASLELLGVDQVRIETAPQGAASKLALPVQQLSALQWQAWLRAAPLQVW